MPGMLRHSSKLMSTNGVCLRTDALMTSISIRPKRYSALALNSDRWLLIYNASSPPMTAVVRNDGRGSHFMALNTTAGGDSRGGADMLAVVCAVSFSPVPAKNGTSALTNGTISCGPRLVSQFLSRTTSSSSHVAPALTRSSRTPGHEVMLRPCVRPADASTHGP